MEEDELRNHLRAIFRDELQDHVSTLERGAIVLSRQDLDETEARAAIAEIYRAAHSLKGASRAVAYPEVEILCDALESELATAKREGKALDRDAVRERTESTARALRDFAARRPELGAITAEAIVPPSPSSEPETSGTPGVPPSQGTVRVPVDRLDHLLRAAEDLLEASGDAFDEGRVDVRLAGFDAALDTLRMRIRARADVARDSSLEAALEATARASRALTHAIADERQREHRLRESFTSRALSLADAARRVRAVPFDSIGPGLERAAIETARDAGRKIRFELRGGNVSIDGKVLEAYRDALLHVVRNAVDHGIEPPDERRRLGKPEVGRITVRAEVNGSEVSVRIEDDGRGFAFEGLRSAAEELGLAIPEGAGTKELLQLAFEPGLSTRREPTRTSGRGVGLDIVRQRLGNVRGRVEVESTTGEGTTLCLVAPVDLSVLPGIVVAVREARFVFVTTSIVHLRRITPEEARIVEGGTWLLHEEALIPLVDLDVALGLKLPERAPRGARPCVIVAAGERHAAFWVDAVLETREVVLRPLGPRLRRVPFVSATTMLGDREPLPVLDAFALVEATRPGVATPEAATTTDTRPRILVVDDSITTRQLLRTILETAGYEIVIAQDGETGWSKLVDGPRVEAVVADVEMPHMDGLQLLARVRNHPQLARLPFVLVTALGSDADRRRALDLGADAYVVKSRFDQQTLVDTLEELLR